MTSNMLILLTCISLCSSETRNETKIPKSCLDHIGTSTSDLTLIYLLNRINEQLASTTNANENMIRKLENLDNRILKMEIQNLENNADFRTEYKLMTVRIEHIERSMNSLKHFRCIPADYLRIPTSNSFIDYSDNSTEMSSLNQTKKPKVEYSTDKSKIPYDCTDVLRMFGNVSGVYEIQPQHAPAPIKVYCDHSVRGGGWTVIQNRFNGSLNFYRTWNEYKQGFGDPHGEYWLGLENIHLLTSQKINEVYFLLEDFNKNKVYAHYNGFTIGPESSNYKLLLLGAYEGTAGNSFYDAHNMSFSTYDKDNDLHPINCALRYSGAWWHKKCFTSNLNGNYTESILSEDQFAIGIIWMSFTGYHGSLKSSRMIVRPRIMQITGL